MWPVENGVQDVTLTTKAKVQAQRRNRNVNSQRDIKTHA